MANFWETDAIVSAPSTNFWEADAIVGATPKTSALEQGSSGINEGIAGMLGLPGKLMSGLVNYGLRAETSNDPAGPVQIPEIGGPEFYENIGQRAGLISEVEPQNAGQRLARRTGNAVGAGAVAGPLAGVSSAGGLALNTISSAASGLAEGAAAELGAGENVQMLASLAGGMVPVGASYAARARPQAPSNQQLRQRAGELYDSVENSGVALTPRQAQELQGNVSAAVHPTMDPPSQTRAVSAVNRVYDVNSFTPDGSAPLMDVERARRFAGTNVLASSQTDDAEKAVGATIRREIDGYLNALAAQPEAAQAVRDLGEARATSRRYLASEALDQATLRASRRAATSGSGGNEINTARQNIRAILDSEAKAAGFTPEELAQMNAIVMGTRATNSARSIGGLSPTKGALPLMAGAATGSAAGAGLMSGNPWAVLAAAPSVIGYIAKTMGESLTDAQINRLSATIRNGGVPLPGKTLTAAERAVGAAIIARFATGQERSAQ